MNKTVSPDGTSHSKTRLWLLRLIAISIPFAVFFLVEISLRLLPWLKEYKDPYVNISPVSVFSRQKTGGQEYFSITHRWVLGDRSQRIPVKKGAHTIRIFCLGSSACAGWPHPPQETFSAYLQQALATAFPGKKIEVVNAAAHGFASYRTRLVLDEVVRMEPDAIVVWEGNNEFLEERNYPPPGAFATNFGRHLRTVQWARSIIANRTSMRGDELKGVAEFFWKKTRQQSLRLREDPSQFEKVKEHFQKSFEHMVRKSQRFHVPIVLCTVPVNMRDWVPTVSVNRLTGEQLTHWQDLYLLGRRSLIEGNYQKGIDAMHQAIGLEPDHGESYFWLGRLLEARGQNAGAWEAFSAARDNDYNPFRAISDFNETIRSLAAANANHGVYLLDLERLFREATNYSAPGFDMFLDYVHPTKPANLLVAETLFALLTAGGILKKQATNNRFIYHDVPIEPYGRAYRDELDMRVQVTAIKMAMENRQFESVVNKIENLVEQMTGKRQVNPNDTLINTLLPQDFIEAYRTFHKSLEIEKRTITGPLPSQPEKEDSRRQVDAFYAKWFPLGTY